MIQFSTTAQESFANGIKAIIYSASGVGKTVATMTTPAPFIISAESGLLSVSRRNLENIHGANNPHVTYDAPVAKIRTMRDLQEVYNWCASSHEARQYWTFNLDSLSEIAEVVLANEKAKYKDPRQAYGGLANEMVQCVKAFRDLPGKNVLMCAKQELVQDYGGVNKVVPSFPGRTLVAEMPYFFDAVFYLGIGRGQDGKDFRYVLTQPQPNYDAKDRSGLLATFEPPDLTHIFRKMLGV